MLQRLKTPLIGTSSALALAFLLAAPAFACQEQGGPGMGMGRMGLGQPDCNCPHVMPLNPRYLFGIPGNPMRENCPYAQGEAKMPHAPGKSLGVMVHDLTDATLDEKGLGYGVGVARVQLESAAAAAGLKSGDLIVEFNGKPVYSGERLRWLVRQAEVGKVLPIKILRDAAPLTLNATLTEPVAVPKCKEHDVPRIGT